MVQSMMQRWNFCVFVCDVGSRDGGARAPAAAQHGVVGAWVHLGGVEGSKKKGLLDGHPVPGQIRSDQF